MTALPTAEQVRELLDYCPETGVFRWKKRTAICVVVGDVAGRRMSAGRYIQIKIGYRAYLAHRVAWLYVHGEWPANEIDHINGTRTDNRIANLRQASKSLNGHNRRAGQPNGTTGLAGVIRKRGRFQARIVVERRQKYLGIYDTPEQAHAAYLNAKAAVVGGRAQWLHPNDVKGDAQ